MSCGTRQDTYLFHYYNNKFPSFIGMEGTFIKHSSVLGRDAVWHKQQRIASLPKYLCFQFMRFFWKATPDNRDHVGVKCKIMRAVTYPEVRLLSQFC